MITPFRFEQATEAAPAGIAEFVAPTATPGAAAAGDQATSATLESARAEARQAGFQEGLIAGRTEAQATAQQEHAVQMREFRATVQQMLDYRPTIRTEVEREVVDLAFAVARRVLHREVTLDPTAVAGIIRSCIDERSAAEVTRVLVHAADMDTVKQLVGPDVAVDVSGEVARGGALLETSLGTLDARIDSQIEELRTGLADG